MCRRSRTRRSGLARATETGWQSGPGPPGHPNHAHAAWMAAPRRRGPAQSCPRSQSRQRRRRWQRYRGACSLLVVSAVAPNDLIAPDDLVAPDDLLPARGVVLITPDNLLPGGVVDVIAPDDLIAAERHQLIAPDDLLIVGPGVHIAPDDLPGSRSPAQVIRLLADIDQTERPQPRIAGV